MDRWLVELEVRLCRDRETLANEGKVYKHV
jgi:hypothetical protein